MPEEEKQKDDGGTADKLLGLGSGAFGMAARFGMAGIVAYLCVHLILFTIPKMQDKFHEELRIERGAAKEEAEKSRDHGNRASKELGDAMREHTRLMDYHQTMIHHELTEANKKKVK